MHAVDHPMGYEDGVSGVSLWRLDRRTQHLTEEERENLYDIADILLKETDNVKTPQEGRNLLEGANQLVQNADWGKRCPREKSVEKKTSLLERISKTYIENSECIERVPKWEAQDRENKSIRHIETSSGWMLVSTISPALTGIGEIFSMMFAGTPLLGEYLPPIMLTGLGVGGVSSIAQYIEVELFQDIPL